MFFEMICFKECFQNSCIKLIAKRFFVPFSFFLFSKAENRFWITQTSHSFGWTFRREK